MFFSCNILLSRFGLEIVVLYDIFCNKIKAYQYVIASKVIPNKVEKILYKNCRD